MTELRKSDFYFDLPQELIAQDPLSDRSSSRLLKLNKETGEGGVPWLLSETLQRRVRAVRFARRCLLAAHWFQAYLTHDVTLLTKPDGSPQPLTVCPSPRDVCDQRSGFESLQLGLVAFQKPGSPGASLRHSSAPRP